MGAEVLMEHGVPPCCRDLIYWDDKMMIQSELNES